MLGSARIARDPRTSLTYRTAGESSVWRWVCLPVVPSRPKIANGDLASGEVCSEDGKESFGSTSLFVDALFFSSYIVQCLLYIQKECEP